MKRKLLNKNSRLGKLLNGDGRSKLTKRKRKQQSKLQFNKLEKRELLATVSLANGTLTVLGSNVNQTREIVSVSEFGDQLRIYNNSQGFFDSIDSADVNKIVINGRGGNDQLVNQTGIQSIIIGGAGNDTIVGGTGNDFLFGGDGVDTIFGDFQDQGGVNPGDGGNDRIVGGNGNDRLDGKGGDDIINGGAGNDLISGGADNDVINGEAGNDQIFGNDGNDTLNGGQGHDRIHGNFGNDVLVGAPGNDFLLPGQGTDRANGNEGNDLLVSNALNSSNTLIGGLGNDVYRFIGVGASGTDTIQERNSEGSADRINAYGLDDSGTPYTFSPGNQTVLTYGTPFTGFRSVVTSPSGNIERFQGLNEIPDLSKGSLNRANGEFIVTATDSVGIDVLRSAGRVTVNIFGRIGNRYVSIPNVSLSPVEKRVTSSTTATFKYRFANPSQVQLIQQMNSIQTFSVVAEAGQFRDSHGNANSVRVNVG